MRGDKPGELGAFGEFALVCSILAAFISAALDLFNCTICGIFWPYWLISNIIFLVPNVSPVTRSMGMMSPS